MILNFLNTILGSSLGLGSGFGLGIGLNKKRKMMFLKKNLKNLIKRVLEKKTSKIFFWEFVLKNLLMRRREFSFRNEVSKNEFNDTKEKIWSLFRKRVSQKIDFNAVWSDQLSNRKNCMPINHQCNTIIELFIWFSKIKWLEFLAIELSLREISGLKFEVG